MLGGLHATRGINGGSKLVDDAGYAYAAAFSGPDDEEPDAQFGAGIVDTLPTTVCICVL